MGIRHYLKLCALAVLLSCRSTDAPPVVSLEQARQITSAEQDRDYTPPPRSVSDITAVLDQQQPDRGNASAAWRAADRQPSAGATEPQLARFYLQRARAAGRLGRIHQRLYDARKAVEFASAHRLDLYGYLDELGLAEFAAGNLVSAAKAHEGRIDPGLPLNSRRRLFDPYLKLATINASLGRLDQAQKWLNESNSLVSEIAWWYLPPPLLREYWTVLVLQTKSSVDRARGGFDEAEAALREGLRITFSELIPQQETAARLGGPQVGTFPALANELRFDLARVMVAQGRAVEAEIEARMTLLSELKRNGRNTPEAARQIALLAATLFEQGRYPEAERLSREAIKTFEAIGSGAESEHFAWTREQMARAQLYQDRWREALQTFEALENDLSGAPDLRERVIASNSGFAVALVRGARSDRAVPMLERALERKAAAVGPSHYETAELRGYLAMALAARGARDRATDEFRKAVPVLLSPSRQLASDEIGIRARSLRLQEILEEYLSLLMDRADAAAAAEAFRVADAIRGRSVQSALVASSTRAAASDPALADLVRREQDAQRRIAGYQGLLTYILARPTSEQDAESTGDVRRRIDQLRTARAALREEIERRFPSYVELIDPRPTTVDQARTHLRSGEALVATYVSRTRTFVWGLSGESPLAFALTQTGMGAMQGRVTTLRQALYPNGSTVGDIPAFDTGLAHALYVSLLEPIEAVWKGKANLIVVPHGPLGQLPFSLLVTQPHKGSAESDRDALFSGYKSVPFLARMTAVTQLPSVASLGALRDLPPPNAARKPFIGFGDPLFSRAQADASILDDPPELRSRGTSMQMSARGLHLARRAAPQTQTVDSAQLAALPRLPDTAEEVRSIAIALNADPVGDVRIGRAANERSVRSGDLANRRVVMFATHGLVPGDLNGLMQPALALSAPDVADVDGDGLLTVDEILGLRLDADWVVLSACNTAAGDGSGAEAVSGLGRAFFYAGTRALLVSNWPVETESARALTTNLFRRYASNPEISRAEALRQAMLSLIDGAGARDARGQTLFSYAHPLFWAPFSLVGDGGRSR